MSHQIENVRLKFNCPADWDNMDTIDGGKYCGHCQKMVYDFTNAKQQEFLKILAENGGNICGRFRSPLWRPGRLNGKPVTVAYSIPVSFSKNN